MRLSGVVRRTFGRSLVVGSVAQRGLGSGFGGSFVADGVTVVVVLAFCSVNHTRHRSVGFSVKVARAVAPPPRPKFGRIARVVGLKPVGLGLVVRRRAPLG